MRFPTSYRRSVYVVFKSPKGWFKKQISHFYSAAALHAMQSAVIPTAIPSVCPSVRPSVRHTLVPYPDE